MTDWPSPWTCPRCDRTLTSIRAQLEACDYCRARAHPALSAAIPKKEEAK